MPIIGTIASSIQQAPSTQDFESIASTRLTSTAATITFTSIPSTYKHLQVRWAGACGDDYLHIKWNTWNSLDRTGRINATDGVLYPNGSGSPDPTYGFELWQGGVGSSNPGSGVIDFLDYASTTKRKMIKSQFFKPGFGAWSPPQRYCAMSHLVMYSSSTSAINSITFQARPAYPLIVGTTVSLYGIKG